METEIVRLFDTPEGLRKNVRYFNHEVFSYIGQEVWMVYWLINSVFGFKDYEILELKTHMKTTIKESDRQENRIDLRIRLDDSGEIYWIFFMLEDENGPSPKTGSVFEIARFLSSYLSSYNKEPEEDLSGVMMVYLGRKNFLGTDSFQEEYIFRNQSGNQLTDKFKIIYLFKEGSDDSRRGKLVRDLFAEELDQISNDRARERLIEVMETPPEDNDLERIEFLRADEKHICSQMIRESLEARQRCNVAQERADRRARGTDPIQDQLNRLIKGMMEWGMSREEISEKCGIPLNEIPEL